MSKRLMLALSTSSGVAQVCATSEPGDQVFSFEITDYKEQSANLLPMLGQAMQAHQLEAQHFVGLAVNTGPGGFTSLRTACGVAQGLSVAWQIPTFPVSSFQCLIEQATFDRAQLEGLGAILIDARLNEFYAVKSEGNARHLEHEPVLLPVNETSCSAWLSDCNWVVCDGPAAQLINDFKIAAQQHVSAVSAQALARLAWVHFKQGKLSDAHSCQPLYVREKVADTTAERLAKQHGKN